MVRAWYHDNSESDASEPHMPVPTVYLDLDEINKRTGIEYFNFEADGLDSNEEYIELKKTRHYDYEDTISIKRDHPMIDKFYTEHLHEDDEIRLVSEGSGYFDVRDKDDQWIRLHLVKNDMIILPAGLYHRFSLDKTNNFVALRRLFTGVPKWTAQDRQTGQ